MTREDVLNKHSVGEIFNDGIVFDGCTDSIYSAMDEYASHIAISFAEWIDGNNYECFLMTDEGVKHWEIPPGRGNWTTAQLYTLYLETNINKQK